MRGGRLRRWKGLGDAVWIIWRGGLRLPIGVVIRSLWLIIHIFL